MKKIYLLAMSCGVLFSAYAQEEPIATEEAVEEVSIEDEMMLALDLEFLLDMEVTVASKKAERISDAPANITAYSDKDLERLGYYTLRDLADITSGYSSFKGIGETTFETRGQKADGFDNNKHLVLIDGIPFSHSRANAASAEENLPLYFAKRVEFMKGPGSALYGISAFSGVINIVSKDLEENGTIVESKMSVGNVDFKRRMMANVVHKSNAGVSKLNIGLFAKDATNDPLGNGAFANQNSVNRDNVSSIFANLSHSFTEGALEGFGLGMIYSRKQGGLGDFWMAQQSQTYPINDLTWEQTVPYLRYKRELNDKISINSYLKGNISNEKANVGGWQSIHSSGAGASGTLYNVTVFDAEFLGEGTYNVSDHSSLIVGFNYDSRHNPGYPYSYGYTYSQTPGLMYPMDMSFYNRSSSYRTYSFYTQYQHKVESILSGLIITAGARMDMGRVTDKASGNLTNKYNQLSPRIALVQKLTDKLNVKVIYGAALRAPLIKEVGLNEEIMLNNPGLTLPDLKAETISSWDFAVAYNTGKVSLSGTYFLNRTQDALTKANVDGLAGQVQANALGLIKATGFELDANVSPSKSFRLGANYSLAEAMLEGGLITTANVPVGKFNANATYFLDAPFKMSSTLVWHSVTSYRKGTGEGTGSDQMMDGFNVVDLNLVGHVTNNVSLELQVRNLLGTEYRTPTFYAAGDLNVLGPQRSFLASVNVKF